MRVRLKKSMAQADEDNNLSVMNEINYDYDRANNKGIILLPELLGIDTISKIESLMIKFKNIDENGNRKIYISRNVRQYRTLLRKKKLHSEVQDEYHVHAQNRARYQKVFPNCIISAGYTGSRRKLDALKGRSSSLTLILHGSSRKMRDRPFLSVSTSTYYNIDSFMNIFIGMHNSCRKGIC